MTALVSSALTIKSFKIPSKEELAITAWAAPVPKMGSGCILAPSQKRFTPKLEIKTSVAPKTDLEEGEITEVETPRPTISIFGPDEDSDKENDVETPRANSVRTLTHALPLKPISGNVIRRFDVPRIGYSPYASSSRGSSIFRLISATSVKSWRSNADSWRSIASQSARNSRLSYCSQSSRVTNCDYYKPGEGPENLAPGKIVRMPISEDWEPTKSKTRYVIVLWLDKFTRTFTVCPAYTNSMSGVPRDHATEFMPLSHPESREPIKNTTAWAPLFIETLYEGQLKPDAAYTWPVHSNVRITDPIAADMDHRMYHVVGELKEEDTQRLVAKVKHMMMLGGEDTMAQMLKRRAERREQQATDIHRSSVALNKWSWN